jgi:Na+-translocating ferredoxin:NAD+ oxidoreductase RnfG subunit
MITKKTQQAIDKELARMELREIFAKQDRPTVYTVLRHVSQSGMSRDISLLIVEDGRLRNITYLAGKALGDKVKDRNGQWVIRVNGCGMDMGFHLVYSLSSVTYAHNKERAGYVLHHEWA